LQRARKDVISAPDVGSLYDVPINFEKDNLGNLVLEKLHVRPPKKDMKEWRALADRIRHAHETVKIGIVGKYFSTGKFILPTHIFQSSNQLNTPLRIGACGRRSIGSTPKRSKRTERSCGNSNNSTG
jgi:hypothetical protein